MGGDANSINCFKRSSAITAHLRELSPEGRCKKFWAQREATKPVGTIFLDEGNRVLGLKPPSTDQELKRIATCQLSGKFNRRSCNALRAVSLKSFSRNVHREEYRGRFLNRNGTQIGDSLFRRIWPMSESPFWCAVQVVPRHEMKVAQLLASKGYQQFVPTYKVRRKWSDRDKILEMPLFPGYVFCMVQKETSSTVFRMLGVIRIVSFGGKICPVDDHEIMALRQLVNSGRDLSPSSYLKIGEKVQIQQGPLAGIIGTVQAIKNRWQLVISVDMLMRSVAVSIDASEARPVSEQLQRPLGDCAWFGDT